MTGAANAGRANGKRVLEATKAERRLRRLLETRRAIERAKAQAEGAP